MRTKARFPEVPERKGHYESFYLKLCAPGGGKGAWIRHTVHKRPGEPLTAALWFVLFDSGAAGPRATKRQFGADEVDAPNDSYIRVADATLGDGRALGSVETEALEAKWDLTFADQHPPFHHLPREFLYRTALPKTKFLSPYPDAIFNGKLEVGGERDRGRRLAGDGRPQLGRRARRALGLDPGRGLRGPLARGLLRHGGRPDQGRRDDHPLGRQRDARPRRRRSTG